MMCVPSFVRIGRHTMSTVDEIVRWLERHAVVGTAQARLLVWSYAGVHVHVRIESSEQGA